MVEELHSNLKSTATLWIVISHSNFSVMWVFWLQNTVINSNSSNQLMKKFRYKWEQDKDLWTTKNLAVDSDKICVLGA